MINLPALPMPSLPANISIPEMVHPLVVHFAIALPVIILVLEILNFILRRKSLGFVNFIMMIFVFIIFVIAYYTGVTDAENAKALMSPEAKETLKSHRNLGVFLIYGSAIILFLKIIGFASKKFVLRLLFFVGILVFIFGVFNEGKMGGELVYKYGTNVMSQATPTAQDAPVEPAVTPAVNTPAANEPVQGDRKVIPADVVKDAATNASNTIKENVTKVEEKISDEVKSVTDATKKSIENVIEKVENAVQTAPAQ